jgi:xylulokinase
MSLLGLDIGTTNCKGAVFSANGTCLARSSREITILQPYPGWVELDSRAIVDAVFGIIRELALSARDSHDPVRALSISALGEAMTPVSYDRQILGNAIHHSDTRGRKEIDVFLANISREALYAVNPNIVSTAYSLVKLLWLKANELELYKNTYKFLFFGELIFFLLECEVATSFSQANRTLLFDVGKEVWSNQLLGIAGIEACLLPKLVPSGHIAGTVPAAKAATLGLDRNVVCVVGGHDQCCNALGVGICSAGKAVDGIGSVECITPVYAAIPDRNLMLRANLNLEHHVVPGLYVSFIYNQAGSLVKWFRNTFAKNEEAAAPQDLYDRLTAEMAAAPSRLLVLPHFEPTGAPSFIEDSSGVILGLRTSTERGEILKAIMECETFYFLECFESLASLGVDTSRFVASGGGAKSSAWLQIKADIMGVPFERAADPEAGVLGVAMIAGKAIGEFSTYEEACTCFVRAGKIFKPDMKRHAIYREQFERYRQLYPRLIDILKNQNSTYCIGVKNNLKFQ